MSKIWKEHNISSPAEQQPWPWDSHPQLRSNLSLQNTWGVLWCPKNWCKSSQSQVSQEFISRGGAERTRQTGNVLSWISPSLPWLPPPEFFNSNQAWGWCLPSPLRRHHISLTRPSECRMKGALCSQGHWWDDKKYLLIKRSIFEKHAHLCSQPLDALFQDAVVYDYVTETVHRLEHSVRNSRKAFTSKFYRANLYICCFEKRETWHINGKKSIFLSFKTLSRAEQNCTEIIVHV